MWNIKEQVNANQTICYLNCVINTVAKNNITCLIRKPPVKFLRHNIAETFWWCPLRYSSGIFSLPKSQINILPHTSSTTTSNCNLQNHLIYEYIMANIEMDTKYRIIEELNLYDLWPMNQLHHVVSFEYKCRHWLKEYYLEQIVSMRRKLWKNWLHEPKSWR